MCVGNPLSYPCSHTGVFWYYCPSARRDAESDDEVVCDNISFLYGEETDGPCPLKVCQWRKKRGCWTCCSCKQGPNYTGWCTMTVRRPNPSGKGSGTRYILTTCDHGCCDKCTKLERGMSKRWIGLSSPWSPGANCARPTAETPTCSPNHIESESNQEDSPSGAPRDSLHSRTPSREEQSKPLWDAYVSTSRKDPSTPPMLSIESCLKLDELCLEASV